MTDPTGAAGRFDDDPDGTIVAFVNGSLPDDDRAAFERWLPDHPEWRPRVAALRAVADATVAQFGTDTSPATSFDALWATAAARGHDSAEVVASPERPRGVRRVRGLAALGLAGAAVAATVAVFVVTGDEDRDEPSNSVMTALVPTSPSPSQSTDGPASTPAISEAAAALRRAVAESRSRTGATVALTAEVGADGAGVSGLISGLARSTPADVTGGAVIGSGDVDFSGSWNLDLAFELGDLAPAGSPGGRQTAAYDGAGLSVACREGDAPVDVTRADCDVAPFGTTFLSPTSVFDVLAAATDVTLGDPDAVDGEAVDVYQVRTRLAVADAPAGPVVIDVMVSREVGVIRSVVASTEFRATETGGAPVALSLTQSMTFSGYGEPTATTSTSTSTSSSTPARPTVTVSATSAGPRTEPPATQPVTRPADPATTAAGTSAPAPGPQTTSDSSSSVPGPSPTMVTVPMPTTTTTTSPPPGPTFETVVPPRYQTSVP